MTDKERQDIIEKMKAEHGRVISLHAPGKDGDNDVFIVAKRASKAEWKRYRSMLFVDEQRPDALETLTKACVVYPPADEFTALIADEPALAMKIGDQITEAAGGDREFEAKKH